MFKCNIFVANIGPVKTLHIHETVFYWNLLEIKSLVTKGADINAKGTDGDTPLIQSVYKYPNGFNPEIYPEEENDDDSDDFEEFKEPPPPPQIRKRGEMVKKVLQEKPNTNLRNNKGHTALKTIMTKKDAFPSISGPSRERPTLNETVDDTADIYEAMDSLTCSV